MKGRDLLGVVEELERKAPTEPYARSAVSRAYYAAFGELNEYLRARNKLPVGKKNSHDAAWNQLKSGIADTDLSRRAQRSATADLGFDLKRCRQKADYRLGSKMAPHDAKQALEKAERIVRELDSVDAALGP